MTEIERRVAAVNATRARFEGRPFEWGRVDCAKVAAWHLRALRNRSIGIAKAGTYRSALSARRALKRWGVETLSDALDKAGLEPIAPAAALPGDIFVSDGSDDHEALCVFVGNSMMLGFAAEDMAAGLQPIRIADYSLLSAWRA